MRWMLFCCLLWLPGCGAMRAPENRPILNRLDEALPEPDGSFRSTLVGVAIWPVAVPAGLVDAFLVNPAIQIKTAGRHTKELLWEGGDASMFYEAALFLPKVAVTPIVFLGDWLILSAVG